MPALLTLRNLSKYYASGQSVVMGLNNINLSFSAGEFVAITGESGSGKSTLARVLAGILPYEGGELLVEGRPTSHYDGTDWERYRGSRVSFISQSYDILPGCTVLRNVVSALRLTGMEGEEAAARAEEILRRVELWELRGRRAAKLSSGQKQRLSIARALAKPAPILIADEPTGNLDPENSAKVIELLAAAARERLVLMVTHDFGEAAQAATRRITVRDGVITADEALRPALPVEDTAALTAGRKAPRGISLYTARLQMSARPVWSALLLAFFALTAFAVFAFLGTLIVNLDDTSTRIYDASAFPNGDPLRVVAARGDGAEMTGEDWAALLSVPHVEELERYGYTADVKYFYREGIDLTYAYQPVGGDMEDKTEVARSVVLEDRGGGQFFATVPQGREGFLTAGRLPRSIHEVVAAGDESLLGQTIPVYVQDDKNWSRTAYIYLEAEVVGVTAGTDKLYFADDLARALNYMFLDGDGDLFLPVQGLGDTILCSQSLYPTITFGGQERELELRVYGTQQSIFLTLAGTHNSTYRMAFEVSPENFDLIVRPGWGYQVSLTIADYAYTDRVIDALHDMGYAALSPYREGSTTQDEALAAQRLQTLQVCALALAAVLLLQVVVLRALFGMETEEVRLLANLGLTCRTAKRSVLWQVLAFAVGGQLLALAAIALCGGLGVERIVSVLRYLPAPYALLISAVHFAASLLTALWIMGAVRRQVYPFTGRSTDLELGEREEEVEA